MYPSDMTTDLEIEHNNKLYVAEVRILYGEERFELNTATGTTVTYSPSAEDIQIIGDVDIYDLNCSPDGARTETYQTTLDSSRLSSEVRNAFKAKIFNSNWKRV